MFAMVQGKSQFGAHTICARDHHWFAIASGQLKQSAKTTQPSHYLRTACAFGRAFDFFDQGIACVNIDTCIFVAQGLAVFGHGLASCLKRLLLSTFY
jgi:hypothetical protein